MLFLNGIRYNNPNIIQCDLMYQYCISSWIPDTCDRYEYRTHATGM